MSEGQSISRPFAETPFPSIRLVQSISSAAPTSTLFGSQPRRAQVPPKGLESMIATSQPAFRHLYAAPEPAPPVPMPTRSNFLCTLSLHFIFRCSLRLHPTSFLLVSHTISSLSSH